MNMPFRLNLEQQKKRAKELLKSFQQAKIAAIKRFDLHHPKLLHNEISLTDFTAKLADAQLVIARELGCKNWNQLRNHIILMDSLREQTEGAKAVVNEPKSCLHIRCGSDIKQSLSEAGFSGDFLEFSDPFCVGPVNYNYQIKERAQFLHSSYGKNLEQDYSTIYSGLYKSYQALQHSSSQYQDIVLWFEHDTYDQFILIFIFSYYHRFGLPQHLWLVTTNEFPGSVKFNGLGQLPPEGLRLLWQNKQLVTKQQCAEADKHWAAYTHADKLKFHQHIQELTNSTLPYFHTAALRQLQEQPIEDNQLPLTQQMTLELLADSTAKPAGTLFRMLMQQKEPMPFLGDLMFWHILCEMEKKGLIQFIEESEHWPQTLVKQV